jgi:hypothetical protein
MKPSLLTKLSRTLIQGHRSEPEPLKLSIGVIRCFTWNFDDYVYCGSASDFVTDNWNTTRDAGIWVFLQHGVNGITKEGRIDGFKVWLIPRRTLDIQIAVINALGVSGERMSDAVAIFEKLHSLVQADLFSLMRDGIHLKTPGPLSNKAIAPVIDEVLGFRKKYSSGDLSDEQEVKLIKRGGEFLL